MGALAHHDTQMLYDDIDGSSHSCIFYTGCADKPTGSMRMLHYKYEEVPEDFSKRFALDKFPELKGKLVGELGRLVVHPKARGNTVLAALGMATYEYGVGELGCEFVFNYCAPGLVRLYRKIGYRPYNADLIKDENGIRVPMIFITSDKEHLKKMGSPLLKIVDEYYGKGKKPPIDLQIFEDRISDSVASYTVDKDRIWHELQCEVIEAQSGAHSVLTDLTKADMKILSDKGFLIDVKAADFIIKKGVLEREMFIVLEGVFEVLDSKGQQIALVSEGEPIGEMALFREAGVRSANVRAVDEGRLMVLRHKFIKELMNSHPQLAAKILWNISGFMAERLGRSQN